MLITCINDFYSILAIFTPTVGYFHHVKTNIREENSYMDEVPTAYRANYLAEVLEISCITCTTKTKTCVGQQGD